MSWTTVKFTATLLAVSALSVVAVPVRGNLDDLTHPMAQFRRAQIKSVAYDLHFTFQEHSETFEGLATLRVELNDTSAPLRIDLMAGSLHEVAVNGTTVDRLVERNGHFDIPADCLRSGPLEITVSYTGNYSNTGEGLCHFTDPVDGKEYLYTNFEPYGAHRVIPCFDQPDIKATFTMRVDAPAGWAVIGNTLPTTTDSVDKRQAVAFAPTPSLSTYLFFLGAGGYKVWRDTHHGMPMAIYARESLGQFVDAERLFATTKSGLDYYNDFFGYTYPFPKYDHVFAPELGPGAMENPGAVTMNEYMLFRGATTKDDLRDRDNTILHEMAHMWFGDLVTMTWWNDLWLNESFATFSSYLAQDSITKDSAIWQDFYSLKGWAYYQDQLSTTHPIEAEVPSARLAMDNFDGITYAKGASALKQLWFLVGNEAYQRGVANYFKRYAWQNATRAEFMASIAQASGIDLGPWTVAWLQSEGLSQMAPELVCEDGLVKSLYLVQSPVNARDLASHKTQMAFFYFNGDGKLELGEIVPTNYAEAKTEVHGVGGKPCPVFLYPNYGDMDYGLFFLDPMSYETVLNHLPALEDPFLRRMVWGTLYAMVRQEQLPASEFMALILANLPVEHDVDLLEYLLGGRVLNDTFYRFLPPERRDVVAPELEKLLWKQRAAAPVGSDAWLLWNDAAVSLSSRAASMEHLRPLLEEVQLDEPRRWNVVGKLAQLGAADANELIEAELKRDPSDLGVRNALSGRGAIPTLEAKQAQWKRIADPELSLSMQRAAAGSFNNALHPELIQPFVDEWFDTISKTDWDAEQHRIGTWFGSLFPPLYTPEFLERSRAALNAATQLPPRARRAWQESNDQLERVIAVRAHDIRSKRTP